MLRASEREGGEVEQRVALSPLGPVDDGGDLVTLDEDVIDLEVAVDEHRVHGRRTVSASWRLRATTSAGSTSLATSHSHSPSRCDAKFIDATTGPRGQRRVVQRADSGTCRGPRRRRRGRRFAEVTERRSRNGGEREHGRLPPQDLRGRDRRQRHHLDLDVGAGLISVDLQEHVADVQRRALAVSDNDLDLLHVAIIAC